MALPLVKGESRIICGEDVESSGYVDMTVDVIKRYGTDVSYSDGIYLVRGGNGFIAPPKITVEGDWSNAAFFIVAAALNGDIELRGLDINSKQPDRRIFDIIKGMNGDIALKPDGNIEVKKSRLTAADIDAKNIPDLVPVLSVAAGVAKGRTVIYNAGRLRLKESDRLSASANTVNALGGRAVIDGDSLIIDGVDAYKQATVDSVNDHRIAMSAAAAVFASDGEITVTGAEAVNKSYPDFFKDLKSLCGV
jgi:3-phosphoshikimate 1-carboxyvinyltransferase